MQRFTLQNLSLWDWNAEDRSTIMSPFGDRSTDSKFFQKIEGRIQRTFRHNHASIYTNFSQKRWL